MRDSVNLALGQLIVHVLSNEIFQGLVLAGVIGGLNYVALLIREKSKRLKKELEDENK